MDKDILSGQTRRSTLDNSMKTRGMDKESSSGLMAEFMKVNGKKESKVELDYTLIHKECKRRVCGMRERELDG